MKPLQEYIFERFINVFKPEDIRLYAKEAWDMISKAYEYIGGVAGCDSYNDFLNFYVNNAIQEKFMWKIVRRHDHLSAVKIYTLKRGGRKGIIIASDGSEQGKKDLMEILSDDFNMKNRQSWEELSGKALGIALKNGAIPLPNNIIQVLMPDKKDIIPLKDGWFYKRHLGKEEHVKLLVGHPRKNIEFGKPSQELISKLKELSKKYESSDVTTLE